MDKQPPDNDKARIRELEQALAERDATIARQAKELSLTRFFLNAVPDIVYQLDPQGNIVYINEQVSQYGYAPGDIIGRHIEELAHPDDIDNVLCCLKERRTGERGTKNIEVRLFAQDKKHRDFEIRSNVVTGEHVFLLSSEGLYSSPTPDPSHYIGTIGVARDITERKKAQVALRESELRFRTLVEQAGDAFFFSDIDGNIVNANRKAAESLGYTREELLSMNVADIDTSLNSHELIEKFLGTMTPEEPRILQSCQRRKDGSLFPVEIHITFMTFDDKPHILGIARDISLRKKYEEDLIRERDRFADIMKTIPVGVTFVTREGHIMLANDMAEQIFMLTKDKITGRNYNDPAWRILDMNGKPMPDDNLPFSIVKRTGKSVFDVRHMIEWPDGKRIMLSINATPMFDKNGEFDGMVAAVTDVTERERASRALAESEAHLKNIITNAPLGIHIYSIDKDGNVYFTGYNPMAQRISGLDYKNMVGKRIEEAFPEVAEAGRHERYREIARTGDVWESEFDFITRDGKHVVLNIVAFRISDCMVCSMILDVTARKQAEEEIKIRDFAFKSSTNAVGLAALDGTIMDVNDSLIALWRFKDKSDIIGKPITVLGDKESIQQILLEVHRKGSASGEALHVRMDNTIGYISYSISTVYDDKHKPLCYMGFFTDITDRKLAEEEMRINRERLETSQRIGHVGSWEYNLATEKFWGSDESIAIFDFIVADNGDLTPEQVESCIPDRVNVHQSLVDLITEGKPYDLEYDIFTERGGVKKRIISKADLIKDENGNPVKIVGVIHDITERRLAEAALYESERRFRRLAENAKDMIYRMSLPDGAYEYVSPAVRDITGYEPKYFYNTPGFARVTLHPDWVAYFEKAWQDLQKGIVPKTYEYQLIHKSGEARWVNQRNVLVTDENGAPIAIEGIVSDITERKLFEEELKRQEVLLNEVGSIAKIGGWEMDLITRKSVWTRTTYDVVGLEPTDEPPGPDKHLDYYIPEDKPKVAEAIRAFTEDNVPLDFEARFFAPDGSIRWVHAIGRGVWKDGKCVKLFGTLQDITQRKLYETELQRQEELLNDVGSIAKIGGWDNDLVANTAVWTRTAYEIFELYPGKPLPPPFEHINLYAECDREAAAKAIHGLVKDKIPLDFEARVASKSGNLKWVHIIGRGEWKNGKCIRALGTVQDITERKIAEAAQRLSEEKYSKAFHTSPDAITISRIDNGEYLEVNEGFTLMSGYSREEAIGQKANVFGAKLWYDANDRVRFIKQLKERGEVHGVEAKFRHKNGELIYGMVSSTIIEVGGESYLLMMVKDITTHRMLEEQLQQTQKMESIGRLAGGIAHDFNNLMTVILGTSDLALMGLEPGDEFFEDFQEILKTAERASDLTRQLLAFSRRQIADPHIIDLNQVILNMDRMFRRLIGEDIELVVMPATELWTTKIDISQIEQVLTNLVVNARDAMPDGGRLVIETANIILDEEYARSHVETLPGEYIMLAVSDTGIGMDEDTKVKIFEPFFTTKQPGQGTGLGLSTCYGIIKQNRGSIWVYSEQGLGTVFKIFLPRAEGAIEKATFGKSELPPTGTETILIVEDEPSLNKMLVRLLKEHGYNIISASHGEEAIQKAYEYDSTIHLLITDVVMPIMGGKEAAEKIQRVYPSMKVLFMSGYTDNSIVHQGVLEPGLAFIQKPFTLESILTKIREVLD